MANNQLLASDNFASGSLAAGWSTFNGAPGVCKVVTGTPNVTEPTALSTAAGQAWTVLGLLTNQISEVTSQALTSEGGTVLVLRVRQQAATNSCYEVDITNAAAQLFRFDSGTPTQIGSTATSLTFAAGDVWALSVDGASVSVYQNGKRIIFASDTTYTSGYPAYAQYSSVNITHTQVSAWRGYSLVQQNGIWQKQGVILPALSGDLSSTGFGTYNNSAVLTVNGSLKMWFSTGGPTTGAIFSATSTDGKNWTRSASAEIGGFINPGVIEVGGTYYLYCQPEPGGAGDIALYTSTDAATWSQQSTTVLALGTSGQWDAGSLYYFVPVAVISGTWYALYSGAAAGSSLFKVGLATSANGLTWTKSGSNPVLSTASGSRVPSNAFAQIGSLFYVWMQGCQSGQSSAASNPLDPTDTVRYSSPDLINWTQSSNPAPWHAQSSEDVNGTVGQCIPNGIVNVSGKAYLYTTSTASDSSPILYQISLAIGPTSIANIITQSEDGIAQVATDTFQRADGSLGANWTTPTGGTALQIASHFVEPSATSTVCQAVYTGASFGASQYSEITLHALTGTLAQSLVYPTVRSSTTALTNYEAWIASPTATSDAAAKIQKRVAGTPTQIGPTATIDPQVGDVFRLSVVDGSDGFPVLSLFQNGFLILQVQDQSSTPIETGNPGMQASSVLAIADAQINGWAGGNANQLPNYPSPNSWLQPQRNFINKHCL